MPLPIRPCVRAMRPYVPGKSIGEVQRELGLTEVYKLASNENPLGASPKVIEAIREFASQIHLYPEGFATELKAALSAKFDIGTEHIFAGNGSDECIRMLGWVLLDRPEHEVIVGDPSFICYDETANLANCRLIKVPLDKTETHDLSAMARMVSENTRLVFIANPNNPTGTILRKPEMDAFLRDMPAHVLTVLDEAYFEFAEDEPGFPNGLEYVREGLNVCALRTFSKTYGLAGVRCGYGFGPPDLVDAINRARQPFNVNAIAQVAAIAALSDPDHLRKTVTANRDGINRLSEGLKALGFSPCESFANFVFVELGRPAAPIVQGLLKLGVIVRGGDAFGRPHALRISVGTEHEMDALMAALQQVVGEVTHA